MKITLIALSAISALSLGSSALAHEPEAGGQEQRGGRGHRHSSLERTTERLNLTPEQKVQVQPIIDQATPQIENIRREAMEKTRAVLENAMAQIRPMLTPEQQKKLDDAQNERREGREGHGGRKGPRKGGKDRPGAQDEPGNG